MKKIYNTMLVLFLSAALILVTTASAPVSGDFADVPKTHWSYNYVMRLKELNITSGVGENRFGLGQTVTRAEFAAFLSRLMNWETPSQTSLPYSDVKPGDWFYPGIASAYAHGITTAGETAFRPAQPITRAEMAVMLVKALGLGTLADSLNSAVAPFPDVGVEISGYIKIAKDLGIINGITPSQFAPNQSATREQAATMMVFMHERINNKITFINGFYAISSASQMSVISSLDAVSFGWGRLDIDGNTVTLNTERAGGNEYGFPSGFDEPYSLAGGKPRLLMISVKDSDSAGIVNSTALRESALSSICAAINSGANKNGVPIMFDGVVIDFETLKGEQTRGNFTDFLSKLRTQLSPGKLIYTAVHPKTASGEYYDGYDYREIGKLSDKVILMAHDYNPKTLSAAEMEQGIVMTPNAPITDVFYALSAITDPAEGVADKSKILLQISFSSVQWKLDGGRVVNSAPYTPGYDAIAARINSSAQRKYSSIHESPYITFKNETDGTDNVVWYEDAKSVEAKLRLARLFGVGISVWRLGTIPDYGAETGLNVINTLLAK